MAKPFCASLNFIDDFVAHYTGMTSDEIVDDVAKSMKAFVCKTPDDVTFGGKMVQKALDRIARRSPANRTNAYARWHKEGSVDLPSGGGNTSTYVEKTHRWLLCLRRLRKHLHIRGENTNI